MNSKKQIILISRNFPPLVGGMERLNQHLLQEIEKEYLCFLIGPHGASRYLRNPKIAIACPKKPISAFLGCAILKAFFLSKKHHPEMIIAGSGVNALPAWIAARLSGCRWIVYLHGLDVIAKHPIYRYIFLPIIRRADAWLVNSQATARLAINAGLDAERLHILHPGVTLPEMLASPDSVLAWRKRYHLGDDPLLLCVGRLTRRKGLLEFILYSLPKIYKVFPNVRMVIIGEEPKTSLMPSNFSINEIYQVARQTGTINCLAILGRLEDQELNLAYQAASALVFPVLDIPGDIEGFGMVAVEAAAYGLPTVAFDVGGVSDAVSDGVSGWLIPSENYTIMSEKTINILQHTENQFEHKKNCIEHASKFSWSLFGDRLLNIIRNEIDKK